jgi:hypothetical protein
MKIKIFLTVLIRVYDKYPIQTMRESRDSRTQIDYGEESSDYGHDYIPSSFSQETEFAEPMEMLERDSDEDVDAEYTGDHSLNDSELFDAFYSGSEGEDANY